MSDALELDDADQEAWKRDAAFQEALERCGIWFGPERTRDNGVLPHDLQRGLPT